MIYGPKMVQVLEFDARLCGSERAEALELALQPARQQAAETAAAAAAEAERAAAEAAERAREEREAAERQRAEAAAREAEAGRSGSSARRRAAERGAAPTSSADGAAAASDLPMIAAMALGGALALLQEGCGDAELADALQAVELLCANVVAHPDDAKFRTIRMLNPHFQQTVARHKGGLELLGALGFVVQQALEEDALQLVLEEPSLEADIERWSAWYDGLKAARAQLRDALERAASARCRPPSRAEAGTPAATAAATTSRGTRCCTGRVAAAGDVFCCAFRNFYAPVMRQRTTAACRRRARNRAARRRSGVRGAPSRAGLSPTRS